jgi:hypothetical protein
MSEEEQSFDTFSELASVFAGEEPAETTDNGDPASEPQQDNAQAPEGQPEAEPDGQNEETNEAEGDEPEAEGESLDSEQEAEIDEEEAEEAPQTQAFELPDGTKVEQKELLDGYLRQSDYSRKTQELAQQRQQFEQSIEQEALQFRQQQQSIWKACSDNFNNTTPFNHSISSLSRPKNLAT